MKTKICPKCKKEKDFSCFYKDKYTKDGYKYCCKNCINKYQTKCRKKNREKINKKARDYYKKYPWRKTIAGIKQRCNNLNSEIYKYYGGKGIKSCLTEEDCKFLYYRDRAWEMANPQISRKCHDKDYNLDNCEYAEKKDNLAERNKRISSKSILQFNLKDNFIKEWKSISEASKILKISQGDISLCCNNKQKTAGKFKWRFKYDCSIM